MKRNHQSAEAGAAPPARGRQGQHHWLGEGRDTATDRGGRRREGTTHRDKWPHGWLAGAPLMGRCTCCWSGAPQLLPHGSQQIAQGHVEGCDVEGDMMSEERGRSSVPSRWDQWSYVLISICCPWR